MIGLNHYPEPERATVASTEDFAAQGPVSTDPGAGGRVRRRAELME